MAQRPHLAADVVPYPGTSRALQLVLILPSVCLGALNLFSVPIFVLGLGFLFAVTVFEIAALRRRHVPVSACPDIDAIVQEVSQTLGVESPDTFIDADATPNAYAIGMAGNRVIVLTSGVAKFPHDELSFILGHEYGHLVLEHSLTAAVLGALLRRGPFSFFFSFISGPYRLACEYTADRFGLLAVDGDIDTACRALLRVAGASGDFKTTGPEERESFFSRLLEWRESHPFLARRIQELRKYHREAYLDGIAGGLR